ncbi:related to high affinity methionine permease [Ramularia collo-cygni]|uniref:Related to high affinity methionine permease n=1 Tax=Ramularia collo-cygni TaxID=112498 RepID=A0A2D3UYL6_9PEZI|nr:related to high affinity methionine permease [Ramularia collo-cygni]CZT20558.1 related to high affinity methionine permease [Ramularia collo-cygni]
MTRAANGHQETAENSALLLASPNTTIDNYRSIANVERHDSVISNLKLFPADLESDVLPETSALGRTLSWRSAYLLTISKVLGSGIFASPGVILASVGSPGLSLTLWVVGALSAYFGVMVAIEFGSMLPRSGGDKVYLEFVYRRPRYLMSILVATQAIVLGFTAGNCIVFARYILFALGVEAEEFTRKSTAVGLLTGVTIIHACFRKMGIRIQNALGLIKIGMVVFMVFSGLFVILLRQNSEDIDLKVPTTTELDWSWTGLWAGSIWSWGAIATSILKVFFSFAGLNNVNNVLNEVKDPVRTLKSVTLTALATACAMFLLINIAYFSVVPLDEIKTSGEMVAALFFERVFGQNVGRRFLPLMVALGCAGNVMVVTFALSRLNQEIARTGLIPFSRLLSSNAPFQSPLGGLILHYIPSVLVLTIPSGDVYSFILEVESYPVEIFAVAISIGLIYLRIKRPELERPYKAWIPGVLVRIFISCALIAAPFFPSEAQRAKGVLGAAAYALVGLAVIAFGVVYWLVFAKILPKWRGYRLEDQLEVLDDGTTITKVAHVPI